MQYSVHFNMMRRHATSHLIVQYSCSDANGLLAILGVRTNVLDPYVVSMQVCARCCRRPCNCKRPRVKGAW